MLQKRYCLPLLILTALLASSSSRVVAAEMPVEEAWKALPKYEYGQDMAALLAMDRAVIQAMATPESRSKCAARLADLLAAKETTPAARQYICLQLRQIGTPAEVPLLAAMLLKPDTSQIARYALQQIPGEAASAALRAGLDTLKSKLLIGVINSVAVRKDTGAVSALARLADSSDEQVASAAVSALGRIGDDRALAVLTARAEKATVPMARELAVVMLRHADALAKAGKAEPAKAIFDKLGQAGQPRGARRAALEGLLRIEGEKATATVLAWFADADAERRLIASGHLNSVPDAELDKLLAKLGDLPAGSQLAVIELATARRGQEMLPVVLSMIKSDKPELRLAGLRCLRMVGDKSVIPLLLDRLSDEEEVAEASQKVLANLPRAEVVPALLEALDSRPKIRPGVIGVLKSLRCFDAIDPLVELAARPDPAVYDPALDGLRGIADPDKSDIPRLVKMLLKTSEGRHRDEAAKTILIVCDKLPAGADRSELVLAALARVDGSEAPKYLPLLGRLGGAKSLALIQAALESEDAEIQESAVRALCNWPNAEVADKLLEIGKDSPNKAFRHWALRAYIRVVTLKSERPESETLAMLQGAMKLAQSTDDKQLAVERAATVRTIESVDWIAQQLDDPALAQTACKSIVELAHHRFLRHPNMKQFRPILEKVAKISKDPAIAERAKRYGLGL